MSSRNSRIPSPALSQGEPVQPQQKYRRTVSVSSPGALKAPHRLSDMMVSIPVLPSRRSILNDDTNLEEPRRKSWWKGLEQSPRDVMDVPVDNNVAEPQILFEESDEEVLSQENDDYSLNLPESSGTESIKSIVIPRRKLFTEKENLQKKLFSQFGTRETLPKLYQTNTASDKTVTVAPKELFQKKTKAKHIFSAALLDISRDKTINDQNVMAPEPQEKVRNLFGNRPGTKRNNMFANFLVSESEDEILDPPEIPQPKIFAFQKKIDPRRRTSLSSRGVREQSPTSSIVTDSEFDDWKMLPSSTMVENQLEAMIIGGQSPKVARLSKLSEAKESIAETSGSASDKQSNKSTLSKSKSKTMVKDKTEQSISTTNKSKLTHENDTTLDRSRRNKSHSIITRSKNKSGALESSKNDTNSQFHAQQQEAISSDELEQIVQNENDELNFTLRYDNDDNADEVDVAKVVSHHDQNINKLKGITNDSRSSSQAIEVRKSSTSNNSKINDSLEIEKTLANIMGEKSPISEILTQEENNMSIKVAIIEKTHNKTMNSNPTYSVDKAQVVKEAIRDEPDITEINKINEINCKQGENEMENKEVKDDQENNMHKQQQLKEHSTITGSKENTEQEKNCPTKCVENKEFEINNDSEETDKQEIIKKNKTDIENEDGNQNAIQGELEREQHNETEVAENNKTNESEKPSDLEMNSILNENDRTEDEQQDISQEKTDHDEMEVETDENNESENVNEQASDLNEAENEETEDEQQNISQAETEHDEDDMETEENNESNESDEVNEHEINSDVNEAENEEETGDEQQNISRPITEHEKEGDIEIEENNESNKSDEINEHDINSDVNEAENEETEDEQQNMSHAETEHDEVDDMEIDENNEENKSDEINENEDSDVYQQNVSEADSEEDEMEDEDNNENNESEEVNESHVNDSNDEQQNISQESTGHEQEEEEIIETSNISHSTGRNITRNESPDMILLDKTNQYTSFAPRGRNTSIRKTKSIAKPRMNTTLKQSLVPVRDSIGLTDGTSNSSAEGSGWDSHRTTRKTLRQTFGKDFTPRKSLRAMVMEKYAKRQTMENELTSVTAKFPQANSTELIERLNHHDNVENDESRKETLQEFFERIKQRNIEEKARIEEAVKKSLMPPSRDASNLFKVPERPKFFRSTVSKTNKPKPKAKPPNSLVRLEDLPEELREDMKYKPPKRFKPSDAAWITNRLYKFLETKLLPKYDYKSRVRAERLIETIYQFTKEVRRLRGNAPLDAIAELKLEMARLNIVKTHFEFNDFFYEFMPREIRIKVVPDIVNRIPGPRNGVFSDIITGDNEYS